MTITTNQILDGITLALRQAFPNDQIEADTVEQGLVPPAFIVVLASASQAQFIGLRWRRRPTWNITYIPKEGRQECYDVADELYEVLEYIEVPNAGLVRATDMSYQVVDGNLQFSVAFNHTVFKPVDETAMEELEIIQEATNDKK